MAQNMQSAVDVWFASIGTAPDYETMHYWAGTGQSTFDINFAGGYISREHVKAFIREDDTGVTSTVALTFQTASRVVTSQPVPVGWTICIYRDTPKNAPLALFVDGAILNAVNLDRNAKQSVFAVAELLDRFDTTNAMAEEAILRASQALEAAGQAGSDAAAAAAAALAAEAQAVLAGDAAAAAALAATAAETAAVLAGTTAQNALDVANGIDAKATQALAESGQSVTTANNAETTANSIAGTAQTALDQSTQAVDTANLALAQSAGAVGFRNKLINGAVTQVNQRAFSGDWGQLAEGAFGYDRWRKSGANMVQVVEAGGYKPNTVHTLSGTGVTTAQITSPASGNWSITVPNTARDITLEEGTVASVFEIRPYALELSLCQRYYERGYFYSTGYVGPGPGQVLTPIVFKAVKRIVPTVQLSNLVYGNATSAGATGTKDDTAWVICNGISTSAAYVHGNYAASAEL